MLSYIQYLFCFFTGEHIKLSLGTEEVKVCLLEILVSCLLIWCLKDHSVLSLLWLLSGMFLKLLLYVDVNTPWSIVSFAMKSLCAKGITRSVYKNWGAPVYIIVVLMELDPLFQFSASNGWNNYCLVSGKQGIQNANWNWF